jgi:phospholipase A1
MGKMKIYKISILFILLIVNLYADNSKTLTLNIKNNISQSFGLIPYKTNYILPVSYSTKKYKGKDYTKNSEIEFQISFLKDIAHNILGLNDTLYVAYTQHSFWQAYSPSAPFRETNYEPEIFISIPLKYTINSINIKELQFGFNHQSNGQDEYKSRSWNRIILGTLLKKDNLSLRVRAWYRIKEHKKNKEFYEGKDPNAAGDDNPDIEKYLGYGDLNFKYNYNKNQFRIMLRNNLRSNENKGAVKFSFSIPIKNRTYFYFQCFNGYGESLIDYNRNISKIGIGFSMYRGLF